MPARLAYTEKSVITVDLELLIQSLAVIEPLENATEFSSAAITDFGFTVEWSCGASLDSDKLFEMALDFLHVFSVKNATSLYLCYF